MSGGENQRTPRLMIRAEQLRTCHFCSAFSRALESPLQAGSSPFTGLRIELESIDINRIDWIELQILSDERQWNVHGAETETSHKRKKQQIRSQTFCKTKKFPVQKLKEYPKNHPTESAEHGRCWLWHVAGGWSHREDRIGANGNRSVNSTTFSAVP